jgi:hypothetical protein
VIYAINHPVRTEMTAFKQLRQDKNGWFIFGATGFSHTGIFKATRGHCFGWNILINPLDQYILKAKFETNKKVLLLFR